MNIETKIIKTHSFNFNPTDNGGESLVLTTEFIANGDPITNNGGVFINQELTLNSYCNACSMILTGATLTPENLRKLANELAQSRNSII